MENASIVILEPEHGVMDILRWIEKGRFEPHRFDIVSVMIGRADIKRSRSWFMASMEELFTVIGKLNPSVLMLVGALLPSSSDSRVMVRKFVARNSMLQSRCLMAGERRKMEYTRPGKALLMKGGPLPKYYDHEGRLNETGRKVLVQAIQDKYISADPPKRALNLKAVRSRLGGRVSK